METVLLSRHTFEPDHGSEGNVACKTCHPDIYAGHTCYQCYPTGRPGEAEQYTNSQANVKP